MRDGVERAAVCMQITLLNMFGVDKTVLVRQM